MIITTLLFVLISFSDVSSRKPLLHPDIGLTFEQRVSNLGYPVEIHKIETEDDYITTLYRLPHGITNTGNQDQNKSAVLFLHGMGGSPLNFIAMGKGRAPAYYLADMGMDVWLLAARGSAGAFKEKHKKFDWDKDPEYWSYSMHEVAIYDLVTTIDFILKHTGQKKVSLIGHSAGGHECFILLSEKPEYNEKVKLLINWGSAPILKYMDYPIFRLGCEATDLIKPLWKYLGLVEALPLHDSVMPIVRALCADPNWLNFCVMGSWVIGSHKSQMLNPTDLPLMVNDLPRLSAMMVMHFMDNIKHGTFRKFEYGPKKNMKLYGQTDPPHYNLSAAIVPVAFFVGFTDNTIGLDDVLESSKYIPNTVLIHKIAFRSFTHLDYILGQKSTELVYEPTYRLINDYDNGMLPPPEKIQFDHYK